MVWHVLTQQYIHGTAQTFVRQFGRFYHFALIISATLTLFVVIFPNDKNSNNSINAIINFVFGGSSRVQIHRIWINWLLLYREYNNLAHSMTCHIGIESAKAIANIEHSNKNWIVEKSSGDEKRLSKKIVQTNNPYVFPFAAITVTHPHPSNPCFLQKKIAKHTHRGKFIRKEINRNGKSKTGDYK